MNFTSHYQLSKRRDVSTRERFRSLASPRTFRRQRKSRLPAPPSGVNTHRCDGKLQKHPRYVQRADDINYVDDFRRILPLSRVRFGSCGLFCHRLSSPAPASCRQSLTRLRHTSRLVVPSLRAAAAASQCCGDSRAASRCIYIAGRGMTCGPVNFQLADCRCLLPANASLLHFETGGGRGGRYYCTASSS